MNEESSLTIKPRNPPVDESDVEVAINTSSRRSYKEVMDALSSEDQERYI
jgi:hypothetical protein